MVVEATESPSRFMMSLFWYRSKFGILLVEEAFVKEKALKVASLSSHALTVALRDMLFRLSILHAPVPATVVVAKNPGVLVPTLSSIVLPAAFKGARPSSEYIVPETVRLTVGVHLICPGSGS